MLSIFEKVIIEAELFKTKLSDYQLTKNSKIGLHSNNDTMLQLKVLRIFHR